MVEVLVAGELLELDLVPVFAPACQGLDYLAFDLPGGGGAGGLGWEVRVGLGGGDFGATPLPLRLPKGLLGF